MGREDYGSFSHLVENRCPVWPVEREDAKPIEFFDRKAIVNDEANDVYRTRQRMIPGRFPRDFHCIHDTIAVTAWSDFYYFH